MDIKLINKGCNNVHYQWADYTNNKYESRLKEHPLLKNVIATNKQRHTSQSDFNQTKHKKIKRKIKKKKLNHCAVM